MSWDEAYRNLTDADKEQFSRLIGILLQRSFILQDKFDAKSSTTQRNKDYRFAIQHFSLFEEYLQAGGWRIRFDSTYGYIVIEHMQGSHRKILDRLTTNILYILRLIYEEEREKLSMSHHIFTTLGDIQRTMEIFNLQDKRMKKTALNEALTTLRSYQIIDRVNGTDFNDDARILIYPTILYVVSSERLRIVEMKLAETGDHDENILDDGEEEEAEE